MVGTNQVKLLNDDESVHSSEQFRSLFRALRCLEIVLQHLKLLCQQMERLFGLAHERAKYYESQRACTNGYLPEFPAEELVRIGLSSTDGLVSSYDPAADPWSLCRVVNKCRTAPNAALGRTG